MVSTFYMINEAVAGVFIAYIAIKNIAHER